MQINGVDIPDQPVAEVCRRHGAVRLSLFGSILRPDFGPSSDVDMLVEFPARAEVSLLDLGGMLMELQSIIGRRVDLKTAGFLSPYFRDQVIREARPIYDATRAERAA